MRADGGGLCGRGGFVNGFVCFCSSERVSSLVFFSFRFEHELKGSLNYYLFLMELKIFI